MKNIRNEEDSLPIFSAGDVVIFKHNEESWKIIEVDHQLECYYLMSTDGIKRRNSWGLIDSMCYKKQLNN